jgi:hypothetical protein
MQNLTPDEQQRLQSELSSGESILWTGKPGPRVIFHSTDWAVIPFSLLWGGFSIFWEAGVTGHFGLNHGEPAPLFFMLWGIPFVIGGQYFIWGRFFYAAWRKKRLIYAITTRRVIVISLPPWGRTITAFIDALPVIEKEIRDDGIGTLKFGNVSNPTKSGRGSNKDSLNGLYLNSGAPVFVDIQDAAVALSIVTQQRERVSYRSPQE